MHEPHIKPQESGARYDTEWAIISNEQGMGLKFASDTSFSFNAAHYTPEDLTQTTHRHLLKRRKETTVHIDYKQSGIGSNSCGPALMEKYQLNEKVFQFGFTIRPVFKEDE
jgi:beta-galactosidase